MYAGGGGGYRYGNREVYYTGDGRISSDPRDMTFPRKYADRRNYPDDFRSYDRDREMRRDPRKQFYPEYHQPPPPQNHMYRTDPRPQEYRRPDPAEFNRYTNTGYPRSPDSPKYNGKQFERKELIEDERVRRMAGYSPLGVFFIFAGTLLILIGVPNAILCPETHYYFRFWAGLPVVVLGVLGVWHRADYISTAKNWSYIITGLFAHTAVMVGTGLLCWVFVTQSLIMIKWSDQIQDYISLQRTISGPVNISAQTMVYTCIGLDCSTFIILWINYITLYGVALISHNYWDANHKWTGKFEPLVRPFLFNPAGQMGVGQALCFMGFLTGFIAMFDNVLGNNYGHYWSPLWAGFLVMVAGGFMCAACKRPDNGPLVGLVLIVEVLAFLATGAAAVLITMGIVYDSQKITEYKTAIDNGVSNTSILQAYKLHITSLVVLCVTAFVLVVSVLYGLWQIFRLVRFLATGHERKRTPTISEDRSFSIYHRDHRGNDKYPYPVTDKYPLPNYDRYPTKQRY